MGCINFHSSHTIPMEGLCISMSYLSHKDILIHTKSQDYQFGNYLDWMKDQDSCLPWQGQPGLLKWGRLWSSSFLFSIKLQNPSFGLNLKTLYWDLVFIIIIILLNNVLEGIKLRKNLPIVIFFLLHSFYSIHIQKFRIFSKLVKDRYT